MIQPGPALPSPLPPPPPREPPPVVRAGPRLGWWAAGLLLAATAFRLWYATRLELVGDEAYYWLWSRNLDLSYIEKGPGIALVIRAGTALFGPTVFGVRFFAVLLAAGTGAGMYLLGRRLFGAAAGFWALVLGLVTPLFAVGAVLMTIDTVYIFFWTWAALAFWEARDQDRWQPWARVGLLVGAGVLAKYTAAVELLSFALFCAWLPAYRRHLDPRRPRPTFLVTLGVTLLFFLPNAYWNARRGWPTLNALLQRGGLRQRWELRPAELGKFLGEQAGVVSPVIFVALLVCLGWAAGRRRTSAPHVLLVVLFLPLFLFYSLLSLQRAGLANWAAAAYVSGLILLAARAVERAAVSRSWRRWAVLGLAVAALETAVLHDTRWLHLPPNRDPLDRARGSRDLAAQVARTAAATGAGYVIANKYMTASLLAFYLPGQPVTFMPADTPERTEFNRVWPSYRQADHAGPALFVSDFPQVPQTIARDFARIQPLGPVSPEQDQRRVRPYYLFLCQEQRPPATAAPGS